MPTLFALGAAFFFGFAHILVRYGLRTGTPTTAITFNLATMGLVLFTVMGPWADWDQRSAPAMGWFMLGGALAPLTTQFLFYAAIVRVGVARASPLRNTSPLFAGLLAVAWLDEQWTPALLSGTVLIILGATVLGMRDAKTLTSFRTRDLLFALGASILGGIASPIRKFGYSMVTSVPPYFAVRTRSPTLVSNWISLPSSSIPPVDFMSKTNGWMPSSLSLRSVAWSGELNIDSQI